MDFEYSQDEVESLLSSLISSPCGPDSGNASGEESESGKRFEMVLTQAATSEPGIALHTLGTDVLGTDDFVLGGLKMGVESVVPINCDSVMSIDPVLSLPPQSDTVRAALSSDSAAECLALLAGPVKKKPGRKKNQPEVKLEPTQQIQPTQRKKAKASPPTDIPKGLGSTSNQAQPLNILAAKPPVPIMPSASTLTVPISISPTPAIDSKRKLSFSPADYLTPTNTAFSPNSTSYSPPQMPPSASSPTSSHNSPPPTISLNPAVTASPGPAAPTPAAAAAPAPVPALTKHQERMMKNRASADESRKKHKEHVEKLENMCRELLKENSVLRARVLEVEAWAERVGAAANASAAASASASANFDTLFKADPLLDGGNLCFGNLKRTASDAFMGVDVEAGGLQSTAVEAMDNAFFDFFFGSANASSAGTGTVLMVREHLPLKKLFSAVAQSHPFESSQAVLFSFSLFMFPTSVFQGTHFFNRNGAHSSDLSVKTPIFNGLSHYLPRVLQEPNPADAIGSSRNPHLKATLDGPPPLNSIDPRPPSELLVVYPQSNGLIQLPFLRISNKAVATRVATTGYTMPVPGAQLNSKRVPYVVPMPVPSYQKQPPQTTSTSSKPSKSVPPRVCAMQEVLDWVLGEIEWYVPGAESSTTKSESVSGASPTATPSRTQAGETQSGNNQYPFSSDAGGSPKVTHAPKIRVSKERWEALQALLSIPTEKDEKESTTSVISTAFSASNGEVPPFVTATRSALSGTATSLPPVVLNDMPLTASDAVVVVGPGTPPIRSNDERASVKRRNQARGAMGPQLQRVIGMEDVSSELSKEDLVVFREGVQFVDHSVNEQKQLGDLFGDEEATTAYCAVKNGPILQIAADLTDHDGEGGVDEEGYRLMLDVQVIGAKLVRF
ncbi:hypothetical protein HDU81_007229 [Chytriomyces hyalinus]|nr:hypothetical protein HDU81_007229 [Chytriomyces hyalinus]